MRERKGQKLVLSMKEALKKEELRLTAVVRENLGALDYRKSIFRVLLSLRGGVLPALTLITSSTKEPFFSGLSYTNGKKVSPGGMRVTRKNRALQERADSLSW